MTAKKMALLIYVLFTGKMEEGESILRSNEFPYTGLLTASVLIIVAFQVAYLIKFLLGGILP